MLATDPGRGERWSARYAAVSLPVLVLLAGALLRLRAYASDRSLWVDEALLAISVVDRPFSGLMQQLHPPMVAPLGFLFASKAAVVVLGASEHALRLVPLIAGLAALPLMYLLTTGWLGRGAGLLAALLLAVSPPAVRYSAEFKQYSSDLAWTLIILLVASGIARRGDTPGRLVALAAIGSLAVWFSHPAVLVLAGVGTTLVVERWKSGRRRSAFVLVLVAGLWCLSFLGSYTVAQRNADLGYYRDYWQEGFLKVPGSVQELATDVLIPLGLFTYLFPVDPVLPWKVSIVVAAAPWLVGLAATWREKRLFLGLLNLPLAFALAAAALQRYPLSGRLTLFALPLLAPLTAAGIDRLWQLSRAGRRPGPLLLAALLLLPMLSGARSLVHAANVEELRPLLGEVARLRRPGDLVYLYCGAVPAYRFYARHGDGAWRDVDAVEGIDTEIDPAGALEQLERLRGAPRVWAIFSHFDLPSRQQATQRLLRRLDQVGRVLDERAAPGAMARLYDLRGE